MIHPLLKGHHRLPPDWTAHFRAKAVKYSLLLGEIRTRRARTYGQPQPYPRLPTRVQKRNVYKPPTPPSDQSGYQRVQQWRYYRGCLPRR
ncbi:hypothetical protein TNCV_4774471 [Trichonephila clavipes]|nr:hypothetical protein TNCV_4774471 [Trichonephila clavipes]